MMKLLLSIFVFATLLNINSCENRGTKKVFVEKEIVSELNYSDSNAESVRCKGITKKGLRCKNMTNNSNGYCYIHKNQAPGYVRKEPITTYVGRCCAITKKGTRCKRKAQKGSRYCWQHQK